MHSPTLFLHIVLYIYQYDMAQNIANTSHALHCHLFEHTLNHLKNEQQNLPIRTFKYAIIW